MVQDGYGTAMHAAEDLTDGGSLTEAVTKYAERATQSEEQMAQIKAKFEGKFAMMSDPMLTTTTPPSHRIPNTTATTHNIQPPGHN